MTEATRKALKDAAMSDETREALEEIRRMNKR